MASHTYAVEGGAFVLLASHTQSDKGLVANGLSVEAPAPGEDIPHTAAIGGGFSVIIAPDGRPLTEPVPASWEGIIYQDLDFNEIYKAKAIVDPVGQYSRTDIFTLQVRSKVRRHCEVDGADDNEFVHASRFPDLEEPLPTV
jgi:cyanide hydratase